MKNCFLFALLLILVGCSQTNLDVDVSDIITDELKLLRLEENLFEINNANFETKTQELAKRVGPFYVKYLVNPLRVNSTGDSTYKTNLLAYINDRDIREAYNESQKIYTAQKMQTLVSELELCRKRFKYHFPSLALPSKLITCTTGWNYAFAYSDNTLVLSLDMYLGEGSKFYSMLAYPQYQRRKMNEAHVLPDIARGWLLTEFDENEAVNNLLHHCIFYGKLFYAVNALLPTTPDSLLIGYTAKQLDYCNKYEAKLWGFFAEKNKLYQNDLQLIRELTSEGPFTAAIHKDCPPRIAMWVGWQIVRSYMKTNKDVNLEQLMNETDAQKILTKSKYRP